MNLKRISTAELEDELLGRRRKERPCRFEVREKCRWTRSKEIEVKRQKKSKSLKIIFQKLCSTLCGKNHYLINDYTVSIIVRNIKFCPDCGREILVVPGKEPGEG